LLFVDLSTPGVHLNLDVTDRRRLVLAALLTAVALPAIWLFARSSDGKTTPSVAAGVGVPTPEADAAVAADPADDAFGHDMPIFVDGPTTPPKAVVVPIVVPAVEPGEHIDGQATFKRTADPYTTTCSATFAPFNAALTVTNLDNGRQTQCRNKTPKVFEDKSIQIELTTDQFEQIAQLTDAPIHVRISWVP
jgi:hypothetical protein